MRRGAQRQWYRLLAWLERWGWVDALRHARVLRPLGWLRRRFGWNEFLLLAVALVVFVIVDAFLELADDVGEGETRRFDERIVRSLRRADDPALPIGPPWLREVGIDLTALGSIVVICLIVATVAGYLLLQRHYRMTVLVLVATGGGMALNFALKNVFDRARPDVVPHLREISTPSFPSGHAFLSAVVYLTLGALIMGFVQRWRTKVYVMCVALLLTLLVGASRVYLGVHYPTDVVAGWAVGLAWAMVCWVIAHYLHERGKLRRTPEPAGDVDGTGEYDREEREEREGVAK